MAAPRVDVLGGPCDGVASRGGASGVRPGPRLAYIDANGRVWRAPGAGRAFYRLVEGRYVFLGNRARVCRACGGLTPHAEGGRESVACALCGAVPAGPR